MNQAFINLTRFAPANFSLSASLFLHTLFVLLLGRAFLFLDATPQKKPFQTKIHILSKKTSPVVDKQPMRKTRIEKPVQMESVKPQLTITPSAKVAIKESTSIATFHLSSVQARVVTAPNIPSARATFVKSSSMLATFDIPAKTHSAQAVVTPPSLYGKRAMVQSAALVSLPSGVSAIKPKLATSHSGVARRVTGIKHSASVSAFAHSFSKPRSIAASSRNITGQGRSTLVHSGATAFISPQDLLPRSLAQLTDKGILQGYLQILQKDIAAAKSYPERERQAKHEGRVMVAFTLLKNGEIENLRLQEKSKYESLDQAALKAINSVTPFSVFPSEIIEDAIDVVIPFRFELK